MSLTGSARGRRGADRSPGGRADAPPGSRSEGREPGAHATGDGQGLQAGAGLVGEGGEEATEGTPAAEVLRAAQSSRPSWREACTSYPRASQNSAASGFSSGTITLTSGQPSARSFRST